MDSMEATVRIIEAMLASDQCPPPFSATRGSCSHDPRGSTRTTAAASPATRRSVKGLPEKAGGNGLGETADRLEAARLSFG